jgi:phosphate uptake regulator
MINHEGVDRNFRFMVLEVGKQLDSTSRLLEAPSRSLLRKILSRDNYVDILKSLIEKKCISFFRHAPRLDKQSADLVSAINTITNNLERIADFCVNASSRVKKLSSPDFLEHFDFREYFNEIKAAMDVITTAVFEKDTALALRLCESEERLNDLYYADFDRVKEWLRSGEHTEDLLACLYICHYLERIGDSLQNIGEAILFAATGERLKMRQYKALDEALVASPAHSGIEDHSIEFKWETKSGSRIGKVGDGSSTGEEGEDTEAIFKEGAAEKLLREKENIERWEEFSPGLPPRVLEYRSGEEDGDAALLLEFLDGLTVHDLVLSADEAVIERAMTLLKQTLTDIWTRSRCDEVNNSHYIEQLSSRIEDVFRVHPDFRDTYRQVGSMAVRSFDELLEKGRQIDALLPAPFSVFCHGDFNTDNVIYNQREDRIHFIDLYRSRQMDYVQDISVFLVSNFRVPVFEPDLRERLNRVILDCYNFARSFARESGDETFEARLALGLVRSFMTSTRFELNEEFAKVMHMRSVYLLERVSEHQGRPWRDFGLNVDTLTF